MATKGPKALERELALKEVNRQNRHYLDSINNEVFYRPEDYVRYCERSYTRTLKKITTEVVKGDGSKIIMLSGPSSSGKTTSANKLARMISRTGHIAYVVHLDDFFKNRDEIPAGPDGLQDFEGLDALQLDLLQETLSGLLNANGNSIWLPRFDFHTGIREDHAMEVQLLEGDVVLVEGLHALNPVLCDNLPEEQLYKIYVSVHSDIYDNNGDVLLGRRNIRLIRRMIRDYAHRSSGVEATFERWPSVVNGEIQNLFPYRPEADFIVDSIHPYELCVFRERALQLLGELPGDSPYKNEADALTDILQQFEPLDPRIVPRSSLLNEFIGKGA